MTFITVSKENGSYKLNISDRIAVANQEQPIVHQKAIDKYLTKLIAQEQLEDELEVNRLN
jgi:hypothetical protein